MKEVSIYKEFPPITKSQKIILLYDGFTVVFLANAVLIPEADTEKIAKQNTI
jgi:hypothetical protein